MIIFLRREALEITIRAIKRTQIPISVLGATLPILSEIDKYSFEVTIENLPVDVNMRIRPKIRLLGGIRKQVRLKLETA